MPLRRLAGTASSRDARRGRVHRHANARWICLPTLLQANRRRPRERPRRNRSRPSGLCSPHVKYMRIILARPCHFGLPPTCRGGGSGAEKIDVGAVALLDRRQREELSRNCSPTVRTHSGQVRATRTRRLLREGTLDSSRPSKYIMFAEAPRTKCASRRTQSSPTPSPESPGTADTSRSRVGGRAPAMSDV